MGEGEREEGRATVCFVLAKRDQAPPQSSTRETPTSLENEEFFRVPM